MEPSENLSVKNQPAKHFLSLHIAHKGTQKLFHMKKIHALLLFIGACVLIGGSAVTLNSYFTTKHELLSYEQELLQAERANRKLSQNAKALENENQEYTQSIDDLQNKAAQLEEKINELEAVKDNLNDQLNSISTTDSSSAEVYNAVASCFVEEKTVTTPDFTPIVTTSFNKVTSLSVQLERIHSRLNETDISFNRVATNVTETLSAFSGIPSGLPVKGTVSSEFNPQGLPFISDGRVHYGLDISTSSRILPITATAAGTVIEAEFHNEYGYYVLIDHGNGFVTRYAHNTENLVSPGDVVKKGDKIATTGATGQSTGIHCHYEVILNGVMQDPRDFE